MTGNSSLYVFGHQDWAGIGADSGVVFVGETQVHHTLLFCSLAIPMHLHRRPPIFYSSVFSEDIPICYHEHIVKYLSYGFVLTALTP